MEELFPYNFAQYNFFCQALYFREIDKLRYVDMEPLSRLNGEKLRKLPKQSVYLETLSIIFEGFAHFSEFC